MIPDRRAQSWYVDYIISFIIFGLALFMLIDNMPQLSSESQESLIMEANVLSDTLLSEGNPSGWNITEVIEPGILTGMSIDDKKLDQLKAIEYGRARSLYGMRSDFIIYFEKRGSIYNISNFSIYGAPGANISNIDEKFKPDHIVHSKRVTSYKGDVIMMDTVVWSR